MPKIRKTGQFHTCLARLSLVLANFWHSFAIIDQSIHFFLKHKRFQFVPLTVTNRRK